MAGVEGSTKGRSEYYSMCCSVLARSNLLNCYILDKLKLTQTSAGVSSNSRSRWRRLWRLRKENRCVWIIHSPFTHSSHPKLISSAVMFNIYSLHDFHSSTLNYITSIDLLNARYLTCLYNAFVRYNTLHDDVCSLFFCVHCSCVLGKGMRDTRAKEAAALARLNQNYGFLLAGSSQGMHCTQPISTAQYTCPCPCLCPCPCPWLSIMLCWQ